ncbi:hypothetical protein Tco_1568977 [Tanacetum coccineum]
MGVHNKTSSIPPSSTIQKDPHEFDDDDFRIPFLFVIMMPNIIGTITKAVRHNDYSLAIFCVSLFVCFFLLQFCLSKYLSLPKNESSKKFCLKLNMWFLYTAISFGFVYQFTDFFPMHIMVTLYTVVLLWSSFLFCVFVVDDLVKYWKNWRHGEYARLLTEVGTLDNDLSIWEKV